MGSLLKGTVRSYNALNGTAEVELYGSHGQYITVPVATHLDGNVVTDGKRCAILSFDEHNTGDAVLVATYNDVFGMGAGPLAEHDHSGSSGSGGQLEADEALLATEITSGYVLTADGAGGCMWVPAASSGGVVDWDQVASNTEINRDSTTYYDCGVDVTVTVPGPALVKISALAQVGRDTSGNYVQLKISDSGGTAIGLEPSWDVNKWFFVEFTAFKYQSSPGTYTYKLWVRRSGGSGAGSIKWKTLTAVAHSFVP